MLNIYRGTQGLDIPDVRLKADLRLEYRFHRVYIFTRIYVYRSENCTKFAPIRQGRTYGLNNYLRQVKGV